MIKNRIFIWKYSQLRIHDHLGIPCYFITLYKNIICNNKKIVQETWLKFDNIEDSEEDLEQNKIAFKIDEDYVEIYDNGIGYIKPK